MAAGLADIRARIKASLAGVTSGTLSLLAGNIVLGRDVQAEGNTLLSGLSATEPKVFILPGSASHGTTEGSGQYQIPIRLYVSITRSSDYTFEAVENLLNAIVTALSGDDVSWDAPQNYERDAAVIYYELTVDAKGC